MGLSRKNSEPHRVLGIRADADLQEIMDAFVKLEARWRPDRNPGDELAQARYQRIQQSFEVMAGRCGLHPAGEMGMRVGTRQAPEGRRTGPSVLRNRFELSVRVGKLKQAFDHYMDLTAVDVRQTKKDNGLSFTFLKAILRRTPEDKAIYDAESYLRRARHQTEGYYNIHELVSLVRGLDTHVKTGRFDRIIIDYLNRAEKEVERRTQHVEQALATLRHKAPQP